MTQSSEKKILVVDDEPDVRNFLATCIQDAGFIVDTAVDGQDALEKIEKDHAEISLIKNTENKYLSYVRSTLLFNGVGKL